MANIDWKKSSEELPPCDGSYFVAEHPDSSSFVAYYDGYGFLSKNIYLNMNYWGTAIQRREKRYGKLTNDSNQDDG